MDFSDDEADMVRRHISLLELSWTTSLYIVLTIAACLACRFNLFIPQETPLNHEQISKLKNGLEDRLSEVIEDQRVGWKRGLNIQWLKKSKIRGSKEFLLILEFTVARGLYLKNVVCMLDQKASEFHDEVVLGNYQFKIKLKYVEVLA